MKTAGFLLAGYIYNELLVIQIIFKIGKVNHGTSYSVNNKKIKKKLFYMWSRYNMKFWVYYMRRRMIPYLTKVSVV